MEIHLGCVFRDSPVEKVGFFLKKKEERHKLYGNRRGEAFRKQDWAIFLNIRLYSRRKFENLTYTV